MVYYWAMASSELGPKGLHALTWNHILPHPLLVHKAGKAGATDLTVSSALTLVKENTELEAIYSRCDTFNISHLFPHILMFYSG